MNLKTKTIVFLVVFSVILPFAKSEDDFLEWQDKVQKTQIQLDKIENAIKNSYGELSQKELEIKTYKTKLSPILEEKITLQGQIKNIDLNIEKIQMKISNIERQIKDREINIRKTLENLVRTETEFNLQKKMFLQYAMLIYKEDQQFGTMGAPQKENFVKLILSGKTVSETLLEKQYLKNIEHLAGRIIQRLDGYYKRFSQEKEKIADKKSKLENLGKELQKEKDYLESEKLGKLVLIDKTKGKEENFIKLVEKAKKEQEDIYFGLANLEGNKTYISSKLKELENFPKNAESEIYDIGKLFEDKKEKFFSWPVNPSRGISAYFLDPSYKKKFSVVHKAIDIVTPQGTLVKAPKNGFVFKVRDGGYGYSYVIIAHRDNFLTLYGHLSKIYVKKGDLVYSGDTIGLSGGAIGSKGAGVMTTGPHLHFEVFKNSVHVNPLDYLPLSPLPLEYIPAKYWKEKSLEDLEKEN